MTCIIGLIDGGSTWVGADASLTAVSTGERGFTGRPKIWKCNGWVMGVAGPYGFLASPEDCSDMPDREGCTPEELRDWVFQEGKDRKAKQWAVLIGGGGSLATFYDEGLWTVAKDPPYAVIGSGEHWAAGAMFATVGMGPRRRIERALKAAEFHCTTVCGPFSIMKG